MQKDASLSEVIARGPFAAREWIGEVLSNRHQLREGFNWLGLAEAAAFDALAEMRGGTRKVSLAWASVAVEVYAFLAKSTDSYEVRDTLLTSLMYLRSGLIEHFGHEDGHEVLDVGSVVKWFFEELPMSYEDVVSKTEHWTELDITEIRKLRRIKNHLGALEKLPLGEAEEATHLQLWLALRPRLP